MDAIELLTADHDEVLMENVEHHADEEESETFPDVREKMGEPRLQELGAELEAAK